MYMTARISRMVIATLGSIVGLTLTPVLVGAVSQPMPSRLVLQRKTLRVTETKADLERALATDEARGRAYLAMLDQSGTAESASLERSIRESWATERAYLRTLPRSGITLLIPMVEFGGDGFSVYTYRSQGGVIADPITNFWTNAPGADPHEGDADHVIADVTSNGNSPNPWARVPTTDPQFVYICESGNCKWQREQYDIQLPPIDPDPLAPRTHARLFGTLSPDASGHYWTVADAHHDNADFTDASGQYHPAHTCTDDWDHARQSLSDATPSLVYYFSASDSGTAGEGQCAYHDGLVYNDWLM